MIKIPSRENNRQAGRFIEMMMHEWPNTYRLFFSKRYQLPAFRVRDYPQDSDAFRWDAIITCSDAINLITEKEHDGGKLNLFFATNTWASLGMISLYLERELAEAFLRTDLPDSFATEDLHWKRNAYRIFLPLGLFTVETEHGLLHPTCVTVIRHLDNNALIPSDIEADIMRFAKRGARADLNSAKVLLFVAKAAPSRCDLGIAIQLRPEHCIEAVNNFLRIALDHRRLHDIAHYQYDDVQHIGYSRLSDQMFTQEVTRLVLNTILFMGSIPLEYEPQTISPSKEKKGVIKPAMAHARFVGQDLYRPAVRHFQQEHENSGRKLPEHWRAGHWRRQFFGGGRIHRKLIWIQPYKAGEPGEKGSS
jgi:hypothetical protein